MKNSQPLPFRDSNDLQIPPCQDLPRFPVEASEVPCKVKIVSVDKQDTSDASQRNAVDLDKYNGKTVTGKEPFTDTSATASKTAFWHEDRLIKIVEFLAKDEVARILHGCVVWGCLAWVLVTIMLTGIIGFAATKNPWWLASGGISSLVTAITPLLGRVVKYYFPDRTQRGTREKKNHKEN